MLSANEFTERELEILRRGLILYYMNMDCEEFLNLWNKLLPGNS